jgi:hypothetical protein
MPRGYRLVICAAFGLALTAAQQPPEQKKNATAPAQPKPSVTAQTPYAPYANLNADACYKARDHDAADLCAQWRAALAAEKAAHESRRATTWSIVATVLSAFAVAGLAITIWQSRGALGVARKSNLITQRASARATRQSIAAGEQTDVALKIAERNADAVARQVSASERNAERQLRAYVQPTDVIVKNIRSGAFLEVEVALNNNGQTPAYRIESKVEIFTIRFDREDVSFKKHRIKFSDDNIQSKVISLSPKTKTEIVIVGKDRLNIATSTDVLNGKNTIVVAGYIKYFDIFGITRRTTFMNFVPPDRIKDGVCSLPATASRGNNAT